MVLARRPRHHQALRSRPPSSLHNKLAHGPEAALAERKKLRWRPACTGLGWMKACLRRATAFTAQFPDARETTAAAAHGRRCRTCGRTSKATGTEHCKAMSLTISFSATAWCNVRVVRDWLSEPLVRCIRPAGTSLGQFLALPGSLRLPSVPYLVLTARVCLRSLRSCKPTCKL